MKNYSFKVEGMTCASCVTRVEKIISRFDGIQDVSVNLANEKVSFLAGENRSFDEVAKAVSEYGYELKIEDEDSSAKPNVDNFEESKDDYYDSLRHKFALALILTIPVFAISMMMDFSFFHHNWPLSEEYTNKIFLILITPVIFISGSNFFKVFWKNLRHFSFEMNSLIAIGTGAAYGYSSMATLFPNEFEDGSTFPHVYFETAGVIITLILLGKLLEHQSKRKTNDALRRLIELRPKTTRILINGSEKEIPLSELQRGNIVIIRPGEKIPADGIIISGNSSIDESMISGESIPVEKTIDEKIIGGTINLTGTFNFRVTELGDNSILGQIIRLVEQAQASKPPIQKLVDKIASVFVPVVIVLALITFIIWLIIGGNFTTSLINFVAVLIVACPCALGLATPTAIIVGTGKGAANGILIRDGESLESIQKVSTIVFDKTGTITEGKPKIVKVIPIHNSERELILSTASLEAKSEHPLAKAIVSKAKEFNSHLPEPESFQSLSGFGIVGVVKTQSVIVGNLKLMNEYSVQNLIELSTDDKIQGGTEIYVAIDGKLAGILILADELKKTSVTAIHELKRMKIETVMLTGDNEVAAKFIANKIGVDEYRYGVLPAHKLEYVKKKKDENKFVAMVGDGINDAPALAEANVGIAIGTGTDIAIETAQITLVHGDLLRVAQAINLSRQTISTIKQNLFWAFIYNVVLIPLAAFGLLNPMIAALAMSLSSVSVVSNSLRLKRKKI